MFRQETVFSQNMTLSDFENMLPFEKEIFIGHVTHTINEYNKLQKQKRG